MKFINSMCGLQNNSATFPCPFCICHHSLLHKSLAELIKIKQDYDNNLPSLKRKHLAVRRKINKAHVTYLGPRSNDQQLVLAHIEATDDCPGHFCWQAIGPNEKVAEGKAAYDRHCQFHFSTKPELGLLSKSIAWKDIIIDVLHIVLRVVPAIYRATVSAHIDKTQCGDLSQWIFDVHGVVVSSSTSVQSATGKEGSIGNECWHGRVCDKIMQVYEEILDQVHAKGSANHLAGCVVWDAFWLFYEELVVNRCNDDDQAEMK